MAEAGHVAWDLGSYDFLLDGKDFDSIHPSLQRQALLNMEYGLYEVVPDRIYQVRGFDLASISFLRSDTGWIVFDPLTAKETAAAALALVSEHLGERPVVAVVYSHSHGDHFGGVRGVVDEADLRSGVVPVIAPVGFFQWWQVLTLVGLLLLGSFFTGVALWQFVPVSTHGRSVQHDPVADLAGTITSSPGDVISRVAMSPRGTSTRWTAWPA